MIYIGDVSRVLLNVADRQMLVAKLQNSGEGRALEVGERVVAGWEAESTWLVPERGNAPPYESARRSESNG